MIPSSANAVSPLKSRGATLVVAFTSIDGYPVVYHDK